MLEEIIERLSTPDKFSIFLFTLGFSLIVASTGIIRGFKFLGLSTSSPRSKKERILMGSTGTALIIAGVALSLSAPVYIPDISKIQIYAGQDAHRIVADGEDVYLLKKNGNILRISRNHLESG